MKVYTLLLVLLLSCASENTTPNDPGNPDVLPEVLSVKDIYMPGDMGSKDMNSAGKDVHATLDTGDEGGDLTDKTKDIWDRQDLSEDTDREVTVDIRAETTPEKDVVRDEEQPDNTPPILNLKKTVPKYTNLPNPEIVFTSTEGGNIEYAGDCKGDKTTAVAGDNTVVFGPLQDGVYSDCRLRVIDRTETPSQWLIIPEFTVDTVPPDAPRVTNDQWTRQSMLPVKVRGEPLTTVLWMGKGVGSLDQSGEGTVVIGPLSDGNHTEQLRLKDRAGNISKPTSFDLYRYSHLDVCEKDGLHARIASLWHALKPSVENLISASKTRPYNLYTVIIKTSPFIRYVANNNKHSLLLELVGVYEKALDTLTYTNKYGFYYFPNSPRLSLHTLDNTYPMWVTKNADGYPLESILVSSQFLAGVSRLIYIIAQLPSEQQDQALKTFVSRFLPVVMAHYHRWISGVTVDGKYLLKGPFQVRGWGCKFNNQYLAGGMSHDVFTEKKLLKQLGNGASPKYCNAVTDTDMWIYAGLAEIMAANRVAPSLVNIKDAERSFYLGYLKTAVRLLKSRITYQDCHTTAGNVKCAFFDLGIWDSYPDYAYAGYTGATYPKASQARRASAVGWDLSHARRFVDVFESLLKINGYAGIEGIDRPLLKAFATKLRYRVFLGDLQHPLFTNFMDGTNGWYRVGYSNREGFGYGPSDMSLSVIAGGYPAWIEYQPGLKDVFNAVYNAFKSQDANTKGFVSAHYEHCYWSNYKHASCFDLSNTSDSRTRSYLFQFYCGICF